jgi:hypothetical protein
MCIFIRKNRRTEQGFVILSVMVIAVFLSILLGASMMRSNMHLQETQSRIRVQEAFYAADSGIDRAVFELRRDPRWGLNGEDMCDDDGVADTVKCSASVRNEEGQHRGYYDVFLADAWSWNSWPETRWIRSEGWDAERKIRRVILARVIVQNPSRFMISTLGDLHVVSGAVITADMFSRDVYFDINPNFPDEMRKVTIDGGQVMYLREAINAGHDDIIGHESIVQSETSITFAGVDTMRYRALVEELIDQGQGRGCSPGIANPLILNISDLSNVTDCKKAEVIFYDGDIQIHGEYDSSRLIVATGNIYIMGNLEPTPDSPTDLSKRPQIALLAAKDVIIPSAVVQETDGTPGQLLTIESFIMADGQGDAKGTFIAEKPKDKVTSSLNFTGSIAVRGRDMPGVSAVNLDVFRNRNYVHNVVNVGNTGNISFLPFIVNIISWKEVAGSDSFPP